MSAIEPTVEFGKNSDDDTGVNQFDVSFSTLGTPPGGGGSGVQADNWVNKNSQIGGETSLWAEAILDVYTSAIDSGCGFVNASGTLKDIIRGDISKVERLRIYNNRGQLWRTGAPPGNQQVAAAENCRLKVYDEPAASPVWPPTEAPLTGVDGSTDALFWTAVEQLGYYWWNGGGYTLLGGSGEDPALLGYNVGAPLNHSVLEEPHASLPANPAYPGVNEYNIGDGSGAQWWLGTRQSVAGPTGYKDAEGGFVDLQVTVLVNENAAAKFNSWGLGVEYTFVLE